MMVLVLLGLVCTVGGAIGAMVWWVRRPVSGHRIARSATVPLFSHDQASLWSRDDAEDSDLARLRRQ